MRVIDRLRRKASFLAYSRRDFYDGLRSSKSPEEVRRWAAQHSMRGFNQQAVRAAIIGSLASIYQATVFVETGTYRAGTTLCARAYLGLPVFSCERAWWRFALSKLITFNVSGITIVLRSSPEFLREVIANSPLMTRPIFYLDAHWGAYLPLRDEIGLIVALKHFVVIIDDCRVPWTEEYGYDVYNALPISVDLVSDILLFHNIQQVYFPNYPVQVETGIRHGYCVLWRSPELDLAHNKGRFPLNLLSTYKVRKSPHQAVGAISEECD